jgi:hypothetical protein
MERAWLREPMKKVEKATSGLKKRICDRICSANKKVISDRPGWAVEGADEELRKELRMGFTRNSVFDNCHRSSLAAKSY